MCEKCSLEEFKYGLCKHCYFTKRKLCLANNKCILCDRGLIPFKTNNDWNKRICHKSCWKEHNNFY